MIATIGLLLVVVTPLATQAAGQAPDPRVCNDAANPPKDAVTQGGCLAISRIKGSCQACHYIAGAQSFGNIGPALSGMAQRFPDKAKLRAQVFDATKANSKSVMPPYGRHEILTPEELDKVVEWLMTL